MVHDFIRDRLFDVLFDLDKRMGSVCKTIDTSIIDRGPDIVNLIDLSRVRNEILKYDRF